METRDFLKLLLGWGRVHLGLAEALALAVAFAPVGEPASPLLLSSARVYHSRKL